MGNRQTKGRHFRRDQAKGRGGALSPWYQISIGGCGYERKTQEDFPGNGCIGDLSLPDRRVDGECTGSYLHMEWICFH
jgi:hypothetical protein